jgi:hypothetical protein
MKRIRKNTIAMLALGCIIIASSCKKTAQPAPATTVNKFTDIKASSSFDWSTTQKISFQINGISIAASETNLMKVMSTDGKNIYYKQFLAMSTNLTTTIDVPRGTTSVLVTYGSIQKTVAISGNSASFNYGPDINN